MVVESLEHYRNEADVVPVSTAILFEPYHQCWGIYHASRLMSKYDSPGDYDIHNSGTGEMHPSAFEQSREFIVDFLTALGESLTTNIDSNLLPSELFAFSLDYDEVWRWPQE